MISFIGSVTALASPFFAARRLWKFRDEVREGQISFLRSMAYYMLMFFYASVLFALAQYIYFASSLRTRTRQRPKNISTNWNFSPTQQVPSP